MDPTPEEIERVSRYWKKVKDLACDHETIVFEPNSFKCGVCDRSVRMLSDLQIEQIRENARKTPPNS